jgi:hypothetical protein
MNELVLRYTEHVEDGDDVEALRNRTYPLTLELKANCAHFSRYRAHGFEREKDGRRSRGK